MWPFGKKKKKLDSTAQASIADILRDVLVAHPRLEGAPVSVGTITRTGNPCAFVKKLGKTLLEDLGGEEGKVVLSYNASEMALCLMLTFTYGEGSEEMKLIDEHLDFDMDSEDMLPGDITDIETCYILNRPLTEQFFYARNVELTYLKKAASRLVDYVFNWLDIIYEAFEEEF